MSSSPRTPAPSAPEFVDTTPEQIAANLAQFEQTLAAQTAAQSPPEQTKRPDLTAGRRSVERVFHYIAEALRAGVPADKLCDLYDARSEQLDRNPNTTSKRVCNEIVDMIAAHELATQPAPAES